MKKILLILFLLAVNNFAKAQMIIDTSLTPEKLVEQFLSGKGVKINKVTFSGNKLAIAHFTLNNTPVEMKKGILLSTGSVFNAVGPNTYPYTTTAFLDVKTQKLQKGDKDLNRIAHNYTYDAAILEFDFIPFNNKISFTYFFGSEEYPEYVGSRYNDVFGFFVSGPKYHSPKNIATLPLTITPITVNSINEHQNKKGYIDNDVFSNVKPTKALPNQLKKKTTSSKKKSDVIEEDKVEVLFDIDKKKQKKLNKALLENIQYDGITRPLVAWCYVNPYQKYHIKIAIADVGDNSYDSGVFLADGTFNSEKDKHMAYFKDYKDLSKQLNFDSIFNPPPPKKTIPPTKIIAKPVINIDSIEQAEADYFQITDVNFETDKFLIPDTAKKHLGALVNYLKKHPMVKISLFGYTDNQGSKSYNQRLSDNRANSVKDFLIEKSIAANSIFIEGLNFERPAADNNSEEGRARNRRVQISLSYEEEMKEKEKQKNRKPKTEKSVVSKSKTH